jgi:hypothetical protein
MSPADSPPAHLEPETWRFYREAMTALNAAGAPYLVGGAYAFERYTGIERHTKDFDIFCMRDDAEAILGVLRDQVGCRTELTFPHWLGKAYNPGTGDFVDVIFSSGSAIAVVDEGWFAHKVEAEVLGIPAFLCPVEEIVWSKAFIMERERYDGNDVAHLLHARADALDWPRVMRRFEPHWRVLLSHLALFGFIYPDRRGTVPAGVMEDLTRRLQADAAAAPPATRVCQGTLLSRAQYLVDVEKWGYEDARMEPSIQMTSRDIAHWTRAIGDQNRRREDHR